ncbi:hypothetical protein LBMAG18_09240 [Alphaproteobacteria bacterium]|nr:hypothetical protein LBMAG18_09240 [Alphaproteobacteria bacterium]
MINLARLSGFKKFTSTASNLKFFDLFKRFYLRSVYFPPDLVRNHQKFYQQNYLKYIYGKVPINPSLLDADMSSFSLNEYFASNKSKELEKLINAINQFIDDKNCLVLEIKGLNQDVNLTLDHQALSKNLLVCGLINKFNFVRTKHNGSLVLGSINELGELKKNSDYLPLWPHFDAISANLIPQYVAIVNIVSNDDAQTFFVDNQKIIENMAKQYPKELSILLGTKIIVKEFNRSHNVFSTSKQSFSVVERNEVGEFTINLFSDRFKMLVVSETQTTNDEFIKAVSALKAVAIEHKEKMKVVLNSDNQVVFFKNLSLLHGRSALSIDKIREVNYLPFDDSVKKNIMTNSINNFVQQPSNSPLKSLDKFSKLKASPLRFLS